MQRAEGGARQDDVDGFDGEVFAEEGVGSFFADVWDDGGDLVAVKGDGVPALGDGLLEVGIHSGEVRLHASASEHLA